MMQLNLINPVVKHAKTFKRTKKNIALMKQCFCEGNKKGWVSDELWNEVKNKEYKTN